MFNETLNLYICRMVQIVWKQDRTRLRLNKLLCNLIGSLIIHILHLTMYYTRLSFFIHVLHISFYFRGLCNIFNKCHWNLTQLHLCNWEFTEPWHLYTYVIERSMNLDTPYTQFPFNILKLEFHCVTYPRNPSYACVHACLCACVHGCMCACMCLHVYMIMRSNLSRLLYKIL